MKIEILNSNPDSIKHLFQYIEKHIPKNMTLSPIWVEFSLVEYNEYEIDGKHQMDIYLYDYYDDLDNCADISIEDANLLFNNLDYSSSFY